METLTGPVVCVTASSLSPPRSWQSIYGLWEVIDGSGPHFVVLKAV